MTFITPDKKQLRVFIFGLVLILLWFAWKALKANHSTVSLILVCISSVLALLYIFKKEVVVRLYGVWMLVASWIGSAITFVLMFIVFYFVFTPAGLLMRLLKKDPLHITPKSQATTYWIDRPAHAKKLDPSTYERQF